MMPLPFFLRQVAGLPLFWGAATHYPFRQAAWSPERTVRLLAELFLIDELRRRSGVMMVLIPAAGDPSVDPGPNALPRASTPEKTLLLSASSSFALDGPGSFDVQRLLRVFSIGCPSANRRLPSQYPCKRNEHCHALAQTTALVCSPNGTPHVRRDGSLPVLSVSMARV
jgi:hypothetical protein